jgi:hypothetical protein
MQKEGAIAETEIGNLIYPNLHRFGHDSVRVPMNWSFLIIRRVEGGHCLHQLRIYLIRNRHHVQ